MTKNRFHLIAICLLIALLTACSAAPKTSAENDQEQTAADQNSGDKKLPFSADGQSRSEANTAQQAIKVPAGTPVTVRLQQTLSSASSTTGERFAAVLDEPIVVKGVTVAQRGADVSGRVVSAEKSGRLHDSGSLALTLTSIEFGNKQLAVATSSVSAKGSSHKKRNIALIGGGAGAGALIGGLAGGGKGALIGTAVGAGAGTGGAYATGKKDVAFNAERRLTFRLNQTVSVE
jgi:hypothetical protein